MWQGGTKTLQKVGRHRLHKESIMMRMITCLFFALVFAVNSASGDETRAFHWVDDDDYPPIIYARTDGKPAGVFYQIMTEAFHRMGIPLEAEVYPWPRAQKIVADGKADGMITVLTARRREFFVGSDPIFLISEHIFANRNNPRIKEIMSIQSLDEVKAYRVVETIGSGWTEERLKGAKITWVPQLENAFRMLIKNRADIYIANDFLAAIFVQRKISEKGPFSEDYETIVVNPYPLETIAYRLLIRKDSPFVKILDDFNDTIHQMQIDGTIRHIVESTHLPQLKGILNHP